MATETTQIDQAAAKRFKIMRAFLKLSQTELAKDCKLTQGMVGHIENGIREIPTSALKDLFMKHNVNPNFIIIGGNEDIIYKTPGKTLVTDTRELRGEIEVLSAYVKKLQQDVRILSQKQ